ncbi:MAG: Asp-tRNA(Asn)/Glu-tRNA(Gln) amidotransferase GatCAB subunit B [Candidatus Aenigmarchaeota archaeon ex4484_52]|nr:MAG: Asp-tRNA(Asn)/Glu-tRNA(Gln) amidotransferase GatCAB subunit B [Candidatus Aenigmarchaeota archaeon ex4484_52]
MIEQQMIEKGVKIGLETHITLPTKSKLFCCCSNTSKKDETPNTRICPICLGHPGTKPYLNKSAVKIAIKLAIALKCNIAKKTYFSRKTYFYPDLAKDFQITQYEIPIAQKGSVILKTNNKEKKITIRRIHIEEDPAKIIYQKECSFLDYNRSGSPLIEIVTEPDFEDSTQARYYLQKLITMLEYLGIYNLDDETTIKTDANISLAGKNRVEVKNIGGVREVEKALKYEFIRQKNILAKNIIPQMETRGWLDKLGISKPLRLKETEEDYGYIFEPDLPHITIEKDEIENKKKEIPELPEMKSKRFLQQYKLNEKTIERLVRYKDLADLFEYLCKKNIDKKIASSWVTGPITKTLNWNNVRFSSIDLSKQEIYLCLNDFSNNKYSDFIAEKIIQKMVEEAKNEKNVSYKCIIEKYSFCNCNMNLDEIISKLISENKTAFEEFKNGKEKSLNFLVGQVMKETKGRANPKEIIENIKKFK